MNLPPQSGYAVKNWIVPLLAGRAMRGMGICLLVVSMSSVVAGTVTLSPIADTSLYEDNPTNNLGGEFALPIGGAYRVDEPRATVNRGLFKFNIAGALPAGVEITSARLVMKVVQVPSPPEGPPTNSIFELRRILRDWGEGNKRAATNSSSQAKNGALATAGEATWNARFVSNQLWNVPGGSAGVDYDLVNSGEVFVRSLGTYAVDSNPNMIADVQGWLDKPVSNFGWMLRSQSETVRYTNRRFASREDTNNAPALTVEFRDPGELRFKSVALAGGRVTFSFAAKAGQSYAVESSAPLTPGSWSTLTNFPVQSVAGDLTASDSLANSFRFYRLRTPGN